jgi:RimJ/RimL family protein N-acetyltransferase
MIGPQAKAIESERLVLEPLTVAHADEMVHVLANPGLYEFIGGTPPTWAELHDRYTRQVAGPPPERHEGWLNWVLRQRTEQRLTGYVQATLAVPPSPAAPRTPADPPAPQASIAWVVGADWQGQGIASEAARALVTWLQDQGVDPVTASIHPGNAASIAVARRAGLGPTTARDGDEIVWSVRRGPR